MELVNGKRSDKIRAWTNMLFVVMGILTVYEIGYSEGLREGRAEPAPDSLTPAEKE